MMYPTLNKIQLIGEVASIPEISFKKDQYFVTMTLRMVKENGHDEFHRLVFQNKSVLAVRGLQEGDLVYVEGHLESCQWEDEAGNVHQSCLIWIESMKALTQYSEPMRALG